MTATDPQRWLTAAADPIIARELESVFAATAAEIEARGPACWASGRCCNFEKTGHRLYVTGLEAAYAIGRLSSDHSITPEDVARAVTDGGCPFQAANLCGIHAIKPLGCRVYFCDRSAQQWQQELSELMLARIRALHERFDVPYRYAEWRWLLATVLELLPRGTTTTGGSSSGSDDAVAKTRSRDGEGIGLPVIAPPRRPQT